MLFNRIASELHSLGLHLFFVFMLHLFRNFRYSTWIRRLPSTPLKEVIQPHLPIRLPCYDFTPVIGITLGSSLLAVKSLTLGTPNSHGVTGGVYKTRERIHPDMLIRDY